MDLNPDSAAQLDAGVRLIAQDCSQRWPLEDGSLDVVFSSNLFEHFTSKESLRGTLGEAARCLRTGGRLICMGPNIRYVGGAYWDFWDHYLPLTERSLAEVLQVIGFRISRCWPRFLPYTMSHGAAPPVSLVRLYLRLPWCWPVFGKQFLIIAERE
jgi:SAM-dependent methyltransferase